LTTFNVSSYAITGLPGTADSNTIQSQSQSQSESESPQISKNNNNEATENVITYNTSLADIPGEAIERATS
jgi:hypothetical protein